MKKMMMITGNMFMIDGDEDEFVAEKENEMMMITNMSGSYVNISTFSNSFNKDAISMTNMFVKTSSQYNDNHDVVIT